jgi:hypothetical protein
MVEKIIRAGLCACGSEEITYGEMNIDGENLSYDFTCDKCGATGKEWYDVSYSETKMDDDTGCSLEHDHKDGKDCLVHN